MDKVLVLIGDLEDSQSIKDKERERLQKKLAGVLEKINGGKDNGIVSPYTITLGDEFQAVFDDSEAVFEQLLSISAAVHPVRVRFSLAVGTLDTEINKKQAIGMDGPAFHRARGGIELLKEQGELFHISVQETESVELAIINNSLQLLSGEIRGWNKRRLKILELIKKGHDYKQISSAVGISKTAFYKNKEAGMLDVIDELSANIALFLNKFLKQ